MRTNFQKIVTSADLIHDRSVVVDYSFTRRDKQYLLSRVQYWKHFLRSRKIKRLIIMQHNSLDAICIFFAAMEVGVTLIVTPVDREGFVPHLQQVDLAVTNKHFLYWTQTSAYVDLSQSQNLMLYDENETTQDFASATWEYQPEPIDLEFEFINAFTSGSTGAPKKLIHRPRNLIHAIDMAADLFSHEDTFASHCSTVHIGMVAVTMLGPIRAGSTLFTVQWLHELGILASRGIFTKILLYEHDLVNFKKNALLALPHNSFGNCEVMTGGAQCSLAFVTDVFSLGASKFTSLYGNNEAIMHQFTKTFYSPQDEILHADLGSVTSGVEHKIHDGTLWIRSPSQSPDLPTDDQGYFDTKDCVAYRDGKLYYVGRIKWITKNHRLVSDFDIRRSINMALIKDTYHSEYVTSFDYDESNDTFLIEIFPNTSNAHESIVASTQRIRDELQKLIGISTVNLVVDDSIVDFNIMMTGIKPNVFDIKKHIQTIRSNA